MSLASMIAGMTAAVGNAAANTIKNNSNKGSGSKPSGGSQPATSSGGSQPATSSGSTGAAPGGLAGSIIFGSMMNAANNALGNMANKGGGVSGSTGAGSAGIGIFNGSAAEYDRLQQMAKQYGNQWHKATTQEEKDRLHDLATIVNTQLGKTYDEHTGTWSGGFSRPEEIRVEDQLAQGWERYEDSMQQAAEQQQQAIQAGVNSAIEKLNAQRPQIDKITQENNAAAERAYMQTIKPNGSLAENLAANGLLPTGITETSQIQAGNAYQEAINANETTQAELMAELERAITQAELTGDIEAAEAYANMLQQIASQGYQNAMDIVNANQWQQQFDQNQAVTNAGITGIYNGVPTLQAQQQIREYEDQRRQIEQQLALGEIDQQTAAAEVRYLEAQITALNQQIKYNSQQMADL